MDIVLAAIVIAITVLTAVAVLALFVWGAVKDGEAEEQMQTRLGRLKPPRRRR
jgi:hypothetical protein